MTDSERQSEDRHELILRLSSYSVVALEFIFIFVPTIHYSRFYNRFFVLGFVVGDFQHYAFWSLVVCMAIWRYWIPSFAEEYELMKKTVWAISLPVLFFVFIALAPSFVPAYCL